MQFTSVYHSPLGDMTLASDGEALTGLWYDGQKYFGLGLDIGASDCVLPVFDATCRWLDVYFSGEKPDFLPPIRFVGTDFRCRVWRALLTIPYGETVTYGILARRVADEMGVDSMSSQAVGGAVGHNPISILVPCHRVIGADGSLTGYAGGIDRKQRLLAIEGIEKPLFATHS